MHSAMLQDFLPEAAEASDRSNGSRCLLSSLNLNDTRVLAQRSRISGSAYRLAPSKRKTIASESRSETPSPRSLEVALETRLKMLKCTSFPLHHTSLSSCTMASHLLPFIYFSPDNSGHPTEHDHMPMKEVVPMRWSPCGAQALRKDFR